MLAFSDALCLALWEQGAARHAVDRALLLATAASDQDDDPTAWADRPLGARDAHLMRLRCAWFGPHFDGLADCPGCDRRLAFSLDLRRILPAPASDPTPRAVSAAGARFRLPTSRDLAAIACAADVDAAERALLARLQTEGPQAAWSDAERAEIDDALDAADPGAQIELDLACGECGAQWRAPLDIAACLWDEVQAQSQRVAAEVHRLAVAYGWSERDILGMSAARRRLYLQMADA
jgi:hypothetical protein